MDRSYLIRRATEELAAAKRATCPQAAKAHRELAQRYSTMVEDELVPAGSDLLSAQPFL
jgi:hypothetical protein